jgi:hypothetical protein
VWSVNSPTAALSLNLLIARSSLPLPGKRYLISVLDWRHPEQEDSQNLNLIMDVAAALVEIMTGKRKVCSYTLCLDSRINSGIVFKALFLIFKMASPRCLLSSISA